MGERRSRNGSEHSRLSANGHARDASRAPDQLVLGYAEPWVARPGQPVAIHTAADADSFDAALVRLLGVRADGRPQVEELERLQPPTVGPSPVVLPGGSYVTVGPADAFAELSSFTVSCWIYPTLMTRVAQTLLATLSEERPAGRWSSTRDRGVGLRLADGEAFAETPLRPRRWTHIIVACDADAGRGQVSADAARRPRARERRAAAGAAGDG